MLHTDGFKFEPPGRRPGGNNLPGSLATGKGWNSPEEIAAKMLGWLTAVEAAGSEARLVLNRRWAKVGVTSKGLADGVRRFMPWIDEAWPELGRTDTLESSGSGIYNRVYHMYRERVKGRGPLFPKISFEHPLRSAELMPYCEPAMELFVLKKPVSRARIQELFGPR